LGELEQKLNKTSSLREELVHRRYTQLMVPFVHLGVGRVFGELALAVT
jgi:hypothetical protein